VRVVETLIPEVLLVEPSLYHDDRGLFTETFRADEYAKALGVTDPFVQDNHSRSTRDVLRGLHFQREHPQGKLVRVSRGHIFDVAVDVRPESPTFGQWIGAELDDSSLRQLWIPKGFAHGFCVLSDVADVHYKCTEYYQPGDEIGLRWDCETVGVEWPVQKPILSPKDSAFHGLNTLFHELESRTG